MIQFFKCPARVIAVSGHFHAEGQHLAESLSDLAKERMFGKDAEGRLGAESLRGYSGLNLRSLPTLHAPILPDLMPHTTPIEQHSEG